MYTKEQLKKHLQDMGVDPKGTLLVHSSMKAIGPVEGGAETVLDALTEYMAEGLLVLPTHTWRQMGPEYNVFHADREPTCVGILTNLIMKRPGVFRSLHPTHSVAAVGPDAEEYVKGEENARTPCPREGCWGRLYDRNAQILLLGVKLNRNTFLHSVEEWADVPGRVTDELHEFTSVAPTGERYSVPQHRHIGAISENFVKMDEVYQRAGVMKVVRFGDAECRLCDAVGMADVTLEWLKKDISLFGDDAPLEAGL